ncbi:MAG: tetratricopeptide repeat protein [Candidatus Cloacimonetes bacterium]|nr:tetratricopeptide repeat protein [Candidatus Cloacimonadota bacterium]
MRHSLWLLYLLLLTGSLHAREIAEIDEPVLARWQEISQLQVSEKTQSYIAEGTRILERYRELQELEKSASDNTDHTSIGIEVAKLKLKLVSLLKTIEEAALFEMDARQLDDLRVRYEAELEELRKLREELRADILSKGENFLADYRRKLSLQKFRQRDVVAKLCLQLAELYYEKTQDDYFARLDAQLDRVDKGLPPGAEPIRNFYDAVNKYQRIVDEFPYSEYMDDALYNLAYIRENSLDEAEQEASRRLYEQLVRDFPQSRYAPESWMRLGEFWFRNTETDFDTAIGRAIESYGHVLEYPDFDAREKALYKLGWCHYRKGDNERSVEYFSEAVLHAMGLGEERQDLKDESVTYIAVNYADPDWDQADIGHLTPFVRDNPAVRAGYGFQLLETYGDIYQTQIQDWGKAVAAYDSLLTLYPDEARAPFIQEKIIACYGPGALNDPSMAYIEKNQLFDQYNPETAWAANQDSADVAELPALLNQNLRENVVIALHKAYDTHQRENFDAYVDLSRKYLRTFPEDTSAFNIHWNLAKVLESELKQPELAYDEYMAIAAAYPERNVRDAAYNAIIMSETLVGNEGTLEAVLLPGQSPDQEYQASELTPMEQKKLTALLSFVEGFPEDPEAAGYLMVAAKLYYNHSDFSAAGTLFDRLIAEYPDASTHEEAYALKLEGQFAQRDFAAAEATAKTIQQLGLSGATLDKARERQAQSVYASAQDLQKGDDHLAAAREFKRVALEIPDAEFADASLFDAADEFKKAGVFDESAETYLYLADTYPQSSFADRAVSLAAFIQMQELEQPGKAAQTFERLAMDYPQSEHARTAILNSAYTYEQEKDWTSTIRMNQLYVDRYPTAEDANAILFANAGLYLKLNDITNANRIYADFAARFPGDPRTVQAFTERGNWFMENDQREQARAEYESAVRRNRDLVAAGGPGNPFYASKALRQTVEWAVESYNALALHQPEPVFNQDVAEKKRRRDAILDDLAELLAFGTGDVFRARYLMADAHAEFARAWRDQERPAWKTDEERVQGEIGIQNTAHDLAQVALTSFIATTKELEGAIESLKKQQLAHEARVQSLQDWLTASMGDSTAARKDSLNLQPRLTKAGDELTRSLEESQLWTTRSREQVPEIVLADMSLYESRVDLALALPSRQTDLFLRAADIDRNILGGAALVTTQSAIEGWNQGLETIAQVGLARIWRPRVQERVAVLAQKLPRAYHQFALANERDLLAQLEAYETVIGKGEDYKDRQGRDEVDYGNDLLDMAEFNQGYARNSLTIHGSVIELLDANSLSHDLSQSLCDSMLARAFRLEQGARALLDTLSIHKETFWQQFTETASFVYEDAHNTCEDAIYSLEKSGQDLLLACEPVVTAWNPDGLESRKLLYSLAKIDPQQFGDRFGLGERNVTLGSGPDWLVTPVYREGFDAGETDLTGWDSAVTRSLPALTALVPEARPIWKPMTRAIDTLTVALSALEPGANVLDTLGVQPDGETLLRVLQESRGQAGVADTAYFRSSFELTGTPTSASIAIAADDNFYLFFNGEYIDEVHTQPGSITDRKEYDLGEFVREGRNTIAVEVEDADGSSGGLSVWIDVREMQRLTDDLFEEQIRRETAERETLRKSQQKNRIYDKNRVD